MSSGDVVGTAIVNLQANTTGFLSGIANAVSTADKQFSSMGSSLSGLSGLGLIGVTAPIVAIGAAAVKSGEDVNNAYKSIENQTGVVTNANTTLGKSFQNVFTNVPQNAQTVATALSTVYDKSTLLNGGLKLVGTSLDDLTTKFLNWSRISGTDVTTLINATTAWASAWHMSAAQVSDSMDAVNTASQTAGVSTDTLVSDIQRVAPAATQLGLTFNQTTTDVAGFEEAGLKVGTINTAMAKTFSDASKAGEDANTRWSEDISTLEDYTTAVQDGNAAQVKAVESSTEWKQVTTDFSARTLTQLTTAVGDGTFKINDLSKAIDNSSGSINKTAKDTETFSQKLDELKNKAEAALAPLGISIITVLSNLVDALTPVLKVLTTVTTAFSKLPAPVQSTIVVIGIITAALPILGIAIGVVSGALGTLSTAMGTASAAATTVGTRLGILSASEDTTGASTVAMTGEVDTATASLTAEGGAGDTAAVGIGASGDAAVVAEGSMVGLASAIGGVVIAYYALQVSAQLADAAVKQTNADAAASTGGDSTVTSKPAGSTTETTNVPGYGPLKVAQHGGLVTKPTVVLVGEAGPELIVPMDAVHGGVNAAAGATMLSSASAASAQSQGNGDIHFQPGAIQINNPQFTNAAEAQRITDQVSRQIAYKTTEYNRRIGHARG